MHITNTPIDGSVLCVGNRILAQIGSGEFGMVMKGVWSSPAGEREVAVKMLPPDATEKDQIRFLQEAAVNGQFNFHPNIVHLFGVVTVEKPVNT